MLFHLAAKAVNVVLELASGGVEGLANDAMEILARGRHPRPDPGGRGVSDD